MLAFTKHHNKATNHKEGIRKILSFILARCIVFVMHIT